MRSSINSALRRMQVLVGNDGVGIHGWVPEFILPAMSAVLPPPPLAYRHLAATAAQG